MLKLSLILDLKKIIIENNNMIILVKSHSGKKEVCFKKKSKLANTRIILNILFTLKNNDLNKKKHATIVTNKIPILFET